jgi:hypothetical protein
VVAVRTWLVPLTLAWLALACTAERQVLQNDGQVLTECEQAFTALENAPCAFTGTCEREAPGTSGCCVDHFRCASTGVIVEETCAPGCSCSDDSACEFGVAFCSGVCRACPATDICPPCPEGWTRLARNGCPTCTCAPPSQCFQVGEGCPSGNGAQVCIAGAACAAGCDASQRGCCANVCGPRECPGPVKLGCRMACPPGAACETCAADACACELGQWRCSAVCADGLSFACDYP